MCSFLSKEGPAPPGELQARYCYISMHASSHQTPRFACTFANISKESPLSWAQAISPWSESAIVCRSLSKSSSLYLARNTEHDAPYWRGPIWFNINFLTLRALHHYSSNRGPHAALARRLHDELRRNLLGNLVRGPLQVQSRL